MYWKRPLESTIFDGSDEEVIVDEFNDCNFLCPSPAVHFRGNLLTTPKRRALKGSIVAGIRAGSSMATPVRTRKSTTELMSNISGMRTNESIAKLTSSTLEANKPAPVTAPAPAQVSAPPTAQVSDSTVPQVPQVLQVPQVHCPTPIHDKKKAQRVVKKFVAAPQAVPVRQISDDAELAKLTQQNTLQNSGYANCEIVVTDLIREIDRPESPSSRFAKSAAVAKRKWADQHKARGITQKAWLDLFNEKSPRDRRIKWDRQVHFIDEPDEPLFLGPDRPSAPTVLRLTCAPPPPENVSRKAPLTVQRILYLAEIQPPIPKKTPAKRGKNHK
ncbi:hypothetical protein PSACC_02026 [Paramicrosporidium saccamoebae]|uniref:Uncharacterized protein n=1 Tax=Paramicrosporidium saccamoebae TaxID=1246581 RepID=A0A2H9TK91_9FUNG|nr:hypothetical protein PSACC_02026 [Paramicrosporidium saccamoebae]